MTSSAAETLDPATVVGGPAPSPDSYHADPMPWAHAERFLSEAGWSLRTLPSGEVMLSATDGPELGLLLRSRPDQDTEVDGHGLLRAAGGGMLDAALAASVPATDLVDEVLVGLNWVFLRAGPYVGIARSPDRGTEGARTARYGAPIKGRPLNELAGWLCSLDPLRRSIGLAAINAFWNTSDGPTARDKWGLARFETPGDGLVIVGGFRAAAKRLPMARIIEREPKGNDVPVGQSAKAFANANAIAITAQTLMNGSLEPLLSRTSHIPFRLLVGPSAPVARVLLNHGLSAVSGLCVTDAEAARSFIAETGTMIATDDITKQLEISR